MRGFLPGSAKARSLWSASVIQNGSRFSIAYSCATACVRAARPGAARRPLGPSARAAPPQQRATIEKRGAKLGERRHALVVVADEGLGQPSLIGCFCYCQP